MKMLFATRQKLNTNSKDALKKVGLNLDVPLRVGVESVSVRVDGNAFEFLLPMENVFHPGESREAKRECQFEKQSPRLISPRRSILFRFLVISCRLIGGDVDIKVAFSVDLFDFDLLGPCASPVLGKTHQVLS